MPDSFFPWRRRTADPSGEAPAWLARARGKLLNLEPRDLARQAADSVREDWFVIRSIIRLVRIRPAEGAAIVAISGLSVSLMASGLSSLTSLLFKLAKEDSGIASLQFGKNTLRHVPMLAQLPPWATISLMVGLPLLAFVVGHALGGFPSRFLAVRFGEVKLDLRTGLYRSFLDDEHGLSDPRAAFDRHAEIENYANWIENALFDLIKAFRGSLSGLAMLLLIVRFSWSVALAAIAFSGVTKYLTERVRRRRFGAESVPGAPGAVPGGADAGVVGGDGDGDDDDDSIRAEERNAALKLANRARTEFDLSRTLEYLPLYQLWGRAESQRRRFLDYCVELESQHRPAAADTPRAFQGRMDKLIRNGRNILMTVVTRALSLRGPKLMLVVGMQNQLQRAIALLIGMKHTLSGMRQSMSEVTAAVETSSARVAPELPAVPGIHRSIALRELSYRVVDHRAPVLNNLSVEFAVGQRHAVIGPSGAGKSSLLQVLMRFYEPTAGALLVDGQDARNYDARSHRRLMAYVAQAPVFREGSLRNNLLYGSSRMYSDDELFGVLEVLGLAPLVARNPRGLDMRLGRGGVWVSSGEVQRIELGRAVLSEPEILVMDEATGTLDVKTEKRVMEWLARRFAGKTMIFVTHRREPLEYADQIYVLEQGALKSQGRPADLARAA